MPDSRPLTSSDTVPMPRDYSPGEDEDVSVTRAIDGHIMTKSGEEGSNRRPL